MKFATVIAAGALILGCGSVGLYQPAGINPVHEGFATAPGEEAAPDAPAAAAPVESGSPPVEAPPPSVVQSPAPTVPPPAPPTPPIQPAPPAQPAALTFRDVLTFSFLKASDAVAMDEVYAVGNRFFLKPVPMDKVPVAVAAHMARVSEVVLAGDTDRIHDFDDNTPFFVHTHREGYGAGFGYNLGLEYRRALSALHWLKPYVRFGTYFTPYTYVSGGMAFQRVFSDWGDLFDNAVTDDYPMMSMEARAYIPIAEHGSGVYITGYVEGEALDATASQGITVRYFPLKELGVMGGFERWFFGAGTGEVEDLFLGLSYDIGKWWGVALKYIDRQYVGAAPPSDQDTFVTVEVSVRM